MNVKKKEKIWKRANLWLAVVWALAIPTGFLFGWLYSVAFISVVSIYANFASHIAAWRADENELIELRFDQLEKKLDKIIKEQLDEQE